MKKPSKNPELEVRKIDRTLKCLFTEPEILALGKELAEKTQLASQIDADKKRVVKEFDAKIAEADAGIQLASHRRGKTAHDRLRKGAGRGSQLTHDGRS